MNRRFEPADSPADTIADIAPMDRDPLSLFHLDDLRDEMELLRDVLNLPARPGKIDMDDACWDEIIDDLVNNLGPSIVSSAAYEEWGRAATDRTRRALAIQIRRVQKALDHAARCIDAHDSPATGAMLPTTFSRRVETLLGRGVLPLAWVRRLDVFRH